MLWDSWYGRTMIGPHWVSVERLEVAGLDYCAICPLFSSERASGTCLILDSFILFKFIMEGGRLEYIIFLKLCIRMEMIGGQQNFNWLFTKTDDQQ